MMRADQLQGRSRLVAAPIGVWLDWKEVLVMPPIGIGILGCGAVSKIHAEAILRVPELKLRSVCSRSATSAEKLAGQYGVHAYTNLARFLSDPGLQAVAICTPSGTHSELGRAAAATGKHLVVEKPIDITLERADSLIDACRRAGVLLAVSLQSRFLDAPLTIRDAVEAGRLGRLIMAGAHIKWYRSEQYYRSAAWRGTLDMDGGGALINQAIHTVDLLRHIVGPVRSVCAFADTQLHPYIEGEDTAVAALRFESGALGIVEAATSAYPGFKRRLEITGTEGTVVLEGDTISRWNLKDGSDNPCAPAADVSDGSSNPMAIDCEGHRRVMADFAQAILDGRAPAVDGAQARQSLELVRAVYESADSGGAPVRLR